MNISPWDMVVEFRRIAKLPDERWVRTVIVESEGPMRRNQWDGRKVPSLNYTVWAQFANGKRDECGHLHRYYRRAEECEREVLNKFREIGWDARRET